MYSHEQEERDYYPDTEQNNAIHLSIMELKPDDSGKINKLIKEGKFVIVSEITVYCPRTDANIATRRDLWKSFNTREEAEKELENNSDYHSYEEASFFVLPYQDNFSPDYKPATNNDIPF